jgi:DNA-binding SARP family transcriptional activator
MTEFSEGLRKVEFRILGQVELWAGGERHDVGTRKARSVLAFLLCEPGHPVSAETLVSRIWCVEPSEGTTKSLHETVSRLRKRLRDAGGTGLELAQRSRSYVLDIDRHDVDLWRFRHLRDHAQRATAQGDYERATGLFAEADALWRGDPLDGVDGYWVEGVRARFTEERLNARIGRIRAALHLRRHSDLIGEIAGLTHQFPLDESLLELHLLALYGAGRPAEALLIYYQAQQRLRNEIGRDLSPVLRDLHKRMLDEDPSLSSPAPTRRSPSMPAFGSAPPLPASSSVPRDNPDFTGRATELATLISWLDSDEVRSSVPVVVIDGMAGVGKSTFAVHAAHQLRERYPEQIHVRLRANDADEAPLKTAIALGRLLRKLGVPGSMIPTDIEGRAEVLRYKLTGRKTLILLDDALKESQVLPLLPANPGCLVLVTTRRRTLILPGMLPLPLQPMPHADAEALFLRTVGVRAQSADDRASVSRLVRLCGHVPQRICLAGQQLRIHTAWSVSDLVSRFSDLQSGARNMNALFDLSYRYLTTDQQRLLRRLAIHPGDSFSSHAAVAMAGGASAAATEQALEVLLDYHLIEEPVPGRYEFHAVLRDYAEGLANGADSEEDRRLVIRRLLDYYLSMLDRASRVVHPFDRRIVLPESMSSPYVPPLRTRRDCIELLDAEKTSLLAITRYAGSHGWQGHAAALAHLFGGFLDAWGDWADAADLHHRAVDASRDLGDARGEALALTDLGFILCRTRQQARAEECLREALDIVEPLGDAGTEAVALNTLGIIQARSDRYLESLANHDQALALWRRLGDRHGEAEALSYGVLPAARLGRHRDALTRAELALAAYRELGDPHGESRSLNNLGGLQQDAGCYDEALARYEQAMAKFIEIGNRQGEAVTLNNVGDIRRLRGQYEEALKDYRSALSIFGEIGARGAVLQTLNGMATAFADAGNSQDALDQYEKALALAAELGERHTQVISHLGIGEVRLTMNQYLSAADDFRAALKLSQDIADPANEGRALYGLGRALLRIEGPAAAREHWLAALTLLATSNLPEADEVRIRLSELGRS